jgi:hypothetical protein
VKLHVGDPGEAGANNAAVETDRVVVTFAAASSGSMASNVDVAWTNVAGTEDFTYFSLWDNSTAGNCLWIGTITANSVTAGDTFTIPSGSLTLTVELESLSLPVELLLGGDGLRPPFFFFLRLSSSFLEISIPFTAA